MNEIKLRTVYIIRGQYEWDRFVEMAEKSATKWCTYDSIDKEDYHTKFKGFDCICMWIDAKNEATYSDYRWYQKEYRSNSAAYPFCIEMSELLRNVIDMEAFNALLGGLA